MRIPTRKNNNLLSGTIDISFTEFAGAHYPDKAY